MPQGTNLNISPYYDDFDKTKNYYRVLFKPGFPVQARELTTLQSIFQNQVESFGNYFFKDGSVVIPGGVNYQNYFYAVEVQSSFSGIDIGNYLSNLEGLRIRGSSSNVVAKVVKTLPAAESIRNSNTLYVMYESSGGSESNINNFFDAETLLLENDLTYGTTTISAGEGFAITKSVNANSIASSASVNSGVYFVRGTFVDVQPQTIILDQYSNLPSYRVGFNVVEQIVTAQEDSTLYDNSLGSSNFSAPGADRLKISLVLTKKALNDFVDENFIEILRVVNGNAEVFNTDTQLNLVKNELAKRTFDESGDYVVKPFNVFVKESLNDYISNNGIYTDSVKLRNGNTASDDVLLYQVTPGKAYVKGFDINTITSDFIDIKKPRTTKEVSKKQIPFNAGVSVNINRIYGNPTVGLGTTAIISLRNSRLGSNAALASGTEIGVARIYDYSPIETYQNDSSKANIRLFDIQTYTTLTLSSNITLSTPALIAGKSSGARGFLKSSVTNSSTLTLYQVSGNFSKNEQLIVNEEDDGRLITNVTNYDLSDIKSVYSFVGVSTFNADLVLSSKKNISSLGNIFSISSSSGGISTVSAPGVNFVGIASVGNIISYPNVGTSQTSIVYNRVESIGSGGTSITVSAVPSVSGVNIGSLPSSNITVTNFSIISPEFSNKENSSLFTPVGNLNVSEVNFKESEVNIKYQFNNLTVTSSSVTATLTDSNLFFDSFDGQNYSIAYSDGTIEPGLRVDEIVISNGGKTLTISGLSKSTGTCTITCSLRKLNATSRNKTLNRANTLVISRSRLTSSGIGTTSLNDGLTYSNVYGTRVQDSQISLNVPDAIKILGIYESADSADPVLPTVTLTAFSGPNNSTVDYLIGEQLLGQNSKSVAVIVSKPASDTLEVVYLNSNRFQVNEKITSKDTEINATILSSTVGDKNITENYTFDNGQRDTIYDYSRIIRKSQYPAPTRKIKIVFENYTIASTETGDFITASSYPSEYYSNRVLSYSNYRNTDIIDIRPRVAEYSLSSSLSPFEFSTRNFTSLGGYSTYTLSPNKNLIASYKYYLPRIDKIYLNKDSVFSISQGTPADDPEFPLPVSEALEIATIFLPAYLYDVKDAKVVLAKNKRYTMEDISKLEDRIERTERYTSLNLLEMDAKNFSIKDAATGLDRFKSGIFVDNFKSHQNHDIADDNFKAAIDTTNAVLRPQSYSTVLDLQLGSEAISGVTTNYNSNADLSYVRDLGSFNIRKTGDLITLDYFITEYQKQPFATRVENVTPFLVSLWEGTVDTNPSADNWVNEKTLSSNNTIGNYSDLVAKLGVDTKTGLSPVDYVGNFQSILQGIDSSVRNNFGSETITSSSTGGRTGTQFVVNETTSTKVDTKEYTEVIKYIRERNIEFIGKNLKPYTQHYPFFDNIDVSPYIIPKLIEIEMVSGTFQVGETVKTKLNNSQQSSKGSPYISFRLCNINHRNGPFNQPLDSYQINPYTQNNFETDYSSSSTILNVDTKSLQLPSDSSYYGWISIGMELVGSSSNAIARVKNIRLFTDNIGKVVGSLYIPDASVANLPKYETGTKILRLTSIQTNTFNIPGTSESAGEGVFSAAGTTKTKETLTTTTRDAKVTIRTLVPPAPAPVYSGGGGGGGGGTTTGTQVFVPDTSAGRATNFVQSLYVDTLGRRPDSGGQNYWVQQYNADIASGRSPAIAEARIAAAFAISAQQNNDRPGTASANYNITQTTSTPGITFTSKAVNCPYKDPLAQTFTVPEETGVFLQSIGIFFFSKDENLPVTLQIRTVESGVPSQTILPFSEVNLDPSQIYTNEFGLSETSFTFNSPVYLSGGKEYAIVLLSNSTNYRVFISRLGEVDVTTLNLPESKRVIVSKQPTLGSLFKSQNASTWTPSQYEDLKYTIYRCTFTTNPGTVKFFNPKLDVGNDKISRIGNNSIFTLSKRVSVGLGSTGYSSLVVPGVTIVQGSATGKLVSIGGSISSVSLISAGIGYTPSAGSFTYSNIAFNTQTGNGSGAVGIVTVSNGSVSGVVITSGGRNYAVGDVLTVPSIGSGIGTGANFTIVSIASSNTFNLDNVQGDFVAGISTLSYVNSSGITTFVGVGVSVVSVSSDRTYDGLHMKINHRNHAMHSQSNFVTLYNIPPNTIPTTLTNNITSNNVGNITVSSSSEFETFEGVGVGSTNPGYAIIGNEIVSYTSVGAGVIGIQTRGIDGTQALPHNSGDKIYKYELNGVSLRRINKTHNFALVDNTDVHPIDLDSYHIKVDMSSNGIDRSSGSPFPKLYFNRSSIESSENARSSENIQFESLIPTFKTLNFTPTNISARVRTVSGTSVSGTEQSFLDKGFQDITLNGINYFDSPRLICSNINESQFLAGIPANKSLTMELVLSTNNEIVSPVIDLEQSNVVLTTNRINKPVTDFANDGRVNSLRRDPHVAIYTSNKVTLKNPADSLKVILSAKLSASNGIRVLYRLFRNDSIDNDQVWQLFPGYSNIDSLGNTKNSELSDGTPDSLIAPESFGNFVDYEFTEYNLPPFQGYQIKIDIFGTNQADVPLISDLRVIATA